MISTWPGELSMLECFLVRERGRGGRSLLGNKGKESRVARKAGVQVGMKA